MNRAYCKYWRIVGRKQAVRLVIMNRMECHSEEFGFYVRKGWSMGYTLIQTVRFLVSCWENMVTGL